MRTRNHGTNSGRSTPAPPDPPPKRATRSKRKADTLETVDEDGSNGEGISAGSEIDGSAPSTAPQTASASPTKARIVRPPRSKNPFGKPSLMVAFPASPSKPPAKRSRAAAATTASESQTPQQPAAKRQRVESTKSARSRKQNSSAKPSARSSQTPSRPSTPGAQANGTTEAGPSALQSPSQDAPMDASAPESPSTPPTPSPYTIYVADEVDHSPKRPKFTEPPASAEFATELRNYPGFEKALTVKDYVMGAPNSGLKDTLEKVRHLLPEDFNRQKDKDEDHSAVPSITRRRGGRRGKVGRGRWKTAGTTREVPEEIETVPSFNSRGRGGYRVKKSENPRIQSLYHRRAAIRHQYRAIANLQRAALEALAEKSVKILKADPEAHAKLPQYPEVTTKLGEVFEEQYKNLQGKLKVVREFLEKDRKQKEDYEQRQAMFARIAMEEELQVEFCVTVENVIKQYELGVTADQIPLFPEDGSHIIKRIAKPGKFVSIMGTPHFRPGDFPATYGPHVSTAGDTETEQHPANFYRSIHPADRKRYEEALLEKRKPVDPPKKQKQKSTKSLLGSAAVATSTPGEISEAQDLDDDDSSSESATEQTDNLDKHGARLPKKQAPKNGAAPNNRFVVDRFYDYDESEIGNRQVKTKRTNTGETIYVGKDPSPNPKAFYYDQKANGYFASRYKPDDLDADVVELFGMHPVYGLPTKDSRNFNYEEFEEQYGTDAAKAHPYLKPRTDWSEPLAPTHPVIFIEEDKNSGITDDRYKKMYRTSRSEHLIRFEQIFQERPGKSKIDKMLKELWEDFKQVRVGSVYRSPSPPTPQSSPSGKETEVDTSNFDNLVEAVAVQLKTEEEARLARVQLVESRVRQYDPVRDAFISSNTAQPGPTPAPPAVPREDRTKLNLLATIAGQTKASAPAPVQAPVPAQALAPTQAPLPASTYRAFGPAPPPPPPPSAPTSFGWPAPPASFTQAPVTYAPTHGHGHPHPPPPSQPQIQPRLAPSGASSLRQLLPAPPQPSVPPPAPPHSTSMYRY